MERAGGRKVLLSERATSKIVALEEISEYIVIESVLQEAYKGTTLMNDHINGVFFCTEVWLECEKLDMNSSEDGCQGKWEKNINNSPE